MGSTVRNRRHPPRSGHRLGTPGGGLLGASVVVMIATVIPKLGSLVSTPTQVAGQSIGAVAIDLIAPAVTPRQSPRISLLLVCAAVAIVGRDQVDRQNTLSVRSLPAAMQRTLGRPMPSQVDRTAEAPISTRILGLPRAATPRQVHVGQALGM
jgi:hypothetical protein